MDVSRCKSQLPRLKEEVGALKVVTPVSLVPVKFLPLLSRLTACTDQGTPEGTVGGRELHCHCVLGLCS